MVLGKKNNNKKNSYLSIAEPKGKQRRDLNKRRQMNDPSLLKSKTEGKETQATSCYLTQIALNAHVADEEKQLNVKLWGY